MHSSSNCSKCHTVLKWFWALDVFQDTCYSCKMMVQMAMIFLIDTIKDVLIVHFVTYFHNSRRYTVLIEVSEHIWLSLLSKFKGPLPCSNSRWRWWFWVSECFPRVWQWLQSTMQHFFGAETTLLNENTQTLWWVPHMPGSVVGMINEAGEHHDDGEV